MPQATSGTPNSDVIVDSADFDRIRYIDPSPDPTGFTYPWIYRNVDGFYNRSYSMCLQSGCSAMFTFQGASTPVCECQKYRPECLAIGTRVAVYGYESYQVSEVQLWSSYTINGMNNVTHVSGTKQSSDTVYYQSDEMPFGEYTLFIYVGHAEDDAGYYLDWIEYNTTSTDIASSTQTSASSTTSTQTSSTQSAADATGSLGSTNTHHGAPPIGAIAGGVVGGLILLLGALFVVYLWRRRRASMGDHIYGDPMTIGKGQGASSIVVPYAFAQLTRSTRPVRTSSPAIGARLSATDFRVLFGHYRCPRLR